MKLLEEYRKINLTVIIDWNLYKESKNSKFIILNVRHIIKGTKNSEFVALLYTHLSYGKLKHALSKFNITICKNPQKPMLTSFKWEKPD